MFQQLGQWKGPLAIHNAVLDKLDDTKLHTPSIIDLLKLEWATYTHHMALVPSIFLQGGY